MAMHGVSQDPSHGVGEVGELAHTLSKETLGSPDASELGSPRCTPNFDLFNMVVSYKRMALFLEPAADAVELTRFLLGWKMPLCSLLVCMFLNVFFYSVNEVGWITVGVVAVAAPAALGYLQDRCGGRASDSELHRRRYHAVHRRDLQTVHLTKQEAMLEVKDLLKHMDDLLSSACLSAETFYKVLYWDNHTKSSRFYGGMLILMCLLYITPLGWVLAGLNSAIFLWNRDFCRVLLDLRNLLHMGQAQASEGHCDEQEHGHLLDRTPTPTSLEDLSPGSVEEAEEAEPDDEFKDAIEEDDDGPLGAPEYDTISENGLLSRNEPIRSKVSKLTEKLRKRYPTTNTGNCSNCSQIELFKYVDDDRSLVHLKTIKHELLHSVNDIVVVGLDSFYATNDHYFTHELLKSLVEPLLAQPWANVVYYSPEEVKVVSEGYYMANGINISPDKRHIYVVDLFDHNVHVLERKEDNALVSVKTVAVGSLCDNVEVEPVTGDLWLGCHPNAWKIFMSDPKDPGGSEVIQIQNIHSDKPVVTQVYADDGQVIIGSSVATIYGGKLLIGTVYHKALCCDLK